MTTALLQSADLSFEFFPPQTEAGMEQLQVTAVALQQHSPEFFSVTYGAGGSTRERTLSAVKNLQARGFRVFPHISGIGASQSEVAALLQTYANMAIDGLVVLRGDLPSGVMSRGQFAYAADLLRFIRSDQNQHAQQQSPLQLFVAAYPEYHPEAKDAEADIAHFCDKVAAGQVAGAITQFFYNTDAYMHFVEQIDKRGVSVPIIPGVMPIHSFEKVARFVQLCGTEIPRWMRLQAERYRHDPASEKQWGIELVQSLCVRLQSLGVARFHFYTLNRADLVQAILAA